MVCAEDYELRHDQDFLRVQKEKITVDFSRPYPTADTFLPYICSVSGRYGMADIGTADCAHADLYNSNVTSNDEDPTKVY